MVHGTGPGLRCAAPFVGPATLPFADPALTLTTGVAGRSVPQFHSSSALAAAGETTVGAATGGEEGSAVAATVGNSITSAGAPPRCTLALVGTTSIPLTNLALTLSAGVAGSTVGTELRRGIGGWRRLVRIRWRWCGIGRRRLVGIGWWRLVDSTRTVWSVWWWWWHTPDQEECGDK